LFINVPRGEKILSEKGMDGLLAATNIPNVFYLSGVWRLGDLAAVVHRDRLTQPWVVIPRSEVDYLEAAPARPAGVVTYGTFFRELGPQTQFSEREGRIKAVGIDQEPVPSFLDGIVEALSAAGLAKGKVGYDERGLDPALVPEIQQRLTGLDLQPAAAVFREIRMVKTQLEIERLHKAIHITEEAIQEAVSLAREGMPEGEMGLAFEVGQVKRGAQPNMAHVGFGRSGALGMYNFPDDRLQRGDLIRFDVGCVYQGYLSDSARTFSFGPPSDKALTYYNALRAGQEKAFEMIKPGVTGAEIFEATIAEVRRLGIPNYRRQHVGHGMGLALGGYDGPRLAPNDKTPLEPDMVLAVEAPYYEMGLGGLQVEDTVLVTETGHRRLTAMSRNLEVLEP
jgi:Xaa-Pro aminopeptidase